MVAAFLVVVRIEVDIRESETEFGKIKLAVFVRRAYNRYGDLTKKLFVVEERKAKGRETSSYFHTRSRLAIEVESR
jgi:hypothetical protein